MLAEVTVAGALTTRLRAGQGRNASRSNSCWCFGYRTTCSTRAKCWLKWHLVSATALRAVKCEMRTEATVAGVSATGRRAGQGGPCWLKQQCIGHKTVCWTRAQCWHKAQLLVFPHRTACWEMRHARKSNSCWRFRHKTACWEAKCLQKQQLLVHRPHDCVLDKGELLAEAAVAGVSATGLRARHGRLGWCLGHMTACCTKANAGRINSCWCLGHRTASRTRAKCWQKQ